MNEPPHRTLLVHIGQDTLHCDVISLTCVADTNTWVLIVDSAAWLDGGCYANCILRRGNVLTPGSYTITDHIVDSEQGFFYAKGLFRPADASPET